MTRIEIQTPSEVGETARVLQLANQRRLADRQADGWAEREAERLAERARSFVGSSASRAATDDPWRGAVPEFDPPPGVRARIPGKQFKVAGAYFKVGSDGRVRIWTADKAKSAEFNATNVIQWFEVFPGGGDRLVIVFYGYSTSFEYVQMPSQITIACLPDELGFPTPTIESVGGPKLVTNLSYQEYKFTAVVTKSEINIIQGWPGPLESVLEQKYTVVTGYVAENTTPVRHVRRWWYDYGCDDDPSEYINQPWTREEDFGIVGYNQEPKLLTTPNAYEHPTLLQFGTDIQVITVWHPLLRSYGYGYLVNRGPDGQSPGWGWTPAVFSFIKNYSGEFHKENGDTTMLTKASSYQYIRDNYISQDSPPYFLVSDVAIPDAKTDTTNTYYYFRAPSYDVPLEYDNPNTFRTTGDTLVPVTLRLNRGKYTREVVEPSFTQTQKEVEKLGWVRVGTGQLEAPIAAWDWDRPLACLIELSRLGFSADDLMLSQGERQSLAEADWDTVGFKF
jgi:hypothetical protein